MCLFVVYEIYGIYITVLRVYSLYLKTEVTLKVSPNFRKRRDIRAKNVSCVLGEASESTWLWLTTKFQSTFAQRERI